MSHAHILGAGGTIAQRLGNYEPRSQQLEMAEAVATAIAERRHLMIEAGTGVGKSFAYLVPAMQAAAAEAIAPAEPEVTIPDSAPESSARRLPAPRCSSKMSTKCFAASCLATRTSGSSSDPLRYVHVPRAFMKERTPMRE